jgi:hypothetical protein
MSRIGAIERWRAWAGSLSNRHRRIAARTAGLASVLAKPRAASRTMQEHWALSTRTLLPRIHLSIQPLLRFDLRPTVAASQVLRQILHESERRSSESNRTVERFRQTDSSTLRVLEAAPLRPIPEAPRIAPLSLVLQRLREPERALAVQRERRAHEGPESRPALARHLAGKVRREERLVDAPAVQVLREDAQSLRSDRAFAASAQERTAALDSWRAMSSASAATAPPGAMPAMSSPSVEVLTEKVMHQIDQRLHAWRERRGGF